MKTRARLGAHCMLVMLSWMVPSLCEATLSKVSPLAVKILYDNSGSMYPGYRPDSAGKSTLGVGFFREYPQFRQWLTDFVTLQSVLNGQTVSLTAVTSAASFDAAGDFIQLQDEVPLAGFNADVFDKLGPDQWGRQTFLAQALEAFTGDFEGLVWLLTDNYVDTGGGDELDRQVVAFFEMLRQDPRYHAVHLFRLPFVDTEHDQRSALAIYGLLISPSPLELDSAAFFDRKFRDTFRLAERPGRRGPLFPEQEHLKLKDLDIEPMILRIDSRLEPRFGKLEKSWFREKRTIELGLPGEIKSHLTQHSVIAGHYDLELVGAFVPDDSAKKEFGVEQMPTSMFGSVSGTLSAEIPPNGTYPLTARLASNQAIELSFRRFWDQLKAALTGLEVEYAGNVRMTFSDVCVRFERSQMRGIFGADLTSEVFDFSDKCRITPQPA